MAWAQGSTTSTISGRVVDSSGGVLPGATVTAKHLGTNTESSTVTNTEGAFTLPSLQAGTYEVTVSLEGFKTTVVRDVVITAVQGADINAKLEIGGVTETVTVASTSEIIQTQSTTISSTITTNQITKLPLTSRSAMDFVNFMPGVTTVSGNRNATINGLPEGVINITIDGVNVQDNTNRSTDGFFSIVSPRLDAIEEVSVTTAGQGADAGQGAVQIKMVTRSGGNQYTGSAYHYYRNDALNANTWFNNRSQVDKADLVQHQSGARFGGPLVIPGLLGRGKAFFFGNYEEFRQPSETTRTRNFLTQSAAQGNYIYGGQTVNVLALAAANGNAAVASTSTLDPTIAALLADIRSAAGTDGTIEALDANINQLRYNLATTSLRRFPTGRVDFNLTDNHRFTSAVNYNYYTDSPDTLNSYDPTFPGFPVQGGQTSKRLVLSNSLRSTLGRNLVNEFRIGYSGSPVRFFDEMNVGMYTGSLANQNGRHLVFPSVVSGLSHAGVNGPNPQSRDASDFTFDDTVTWLKGNHNITGGASWSMFNVWLKNTSLVPRVSFGLLSTDPAQQAITAATLAAATGVTPSQAQLDGARNLYAFLTGRVTQISADARINESTGLYEYVGVGTQRSAMSEGGFFIQDSWRWKPNFTLNAGLRYTMQLPFQAKNNYYSTTTLADLCGPSGVTGNGCTLFQPGHMPGKAVSEFYQLEQGKNAYNTDWDNFAPNVGFAWTPERRGGLLGTLMSDEFVIRGGWARAYSREGMGVFTGQYSANPGGAISVTRNQTNQNILPPGSPGFILLRNEADMGAPSFPEKPVYPMTDLVSQDIRMFDPDIEIPYADSWSFGVQRKLSQNMALEVRYVGTLSRDRWVSRNFNEYNIYENGFLDEFRRAQQNLQANIAAGNGARFNYTGAPGTVPLPIMVQWLSGQPASAAGNTAAYTGNFWNNTTALNELTMRNPDPVGLAQFFMGQALIRANGAAAGAPANFFIANPNHVGGAVLTRNEGETDYHSLQVELRRRLANGLQFSGSYVFGRAYESVFFTHRRGLESLRRIGDGGDIDHQWKLNLVYDLPFGQGRRFLGGAGPVLERLVGGWQIGFNTRIQTGRLTEISGVKLVGWTEDEVRDAYKIRFEDDNKLIFMWPEDVITNTIRAFSTAATATGYSGPAPEGRYFAPENDANCIALVPGDCGGIKSMILRGPLFEQSDLRIAKRTQIVGRVNFEISAEALNVFNRANFTPVLGISSTAANWRVTGLSGNNTARLLQIVSRLNW
ncbi:MAG TPA: TonB-dependent receptor [Vicinamibacterales bacterium]